MPAQPRALEAQATSDLIPDLPARSGPDRVVLLARDPVFGHAYWELGAERVQRAVRELGGAGHGVLRLVDIEHGDIIAAFEINAEHGRFVLRFPASDRRYGLELGVESADGRRAIIMLHSNVVMVPPSLPREKGEVVYVDLAPQREVLAAAENTAKPPRLRVDYPDPAKPRRPPPIGSIEVARQAAAHADRERRGLSILDAAAEVAAETRRRVNESSSRAPLAPHEEKRV